MGQRPEDVDDRWARATVVSERGQGGSIHVDAVERVAHEFHDVELTHVHAIPQPVMDGIASTQHDYYVIFSIVRQVLAMRSELVATLVERRPLQPFDDGGGSTPRRITAVEDSGVSNDDRHDRFVN